MAGDTRATVGVQRDFVELLPHAVANRLWLVPCLMLEWRTHHA